MQETISGPYANVTITDVQLASIYFPILLELAKNKQCITANELAIRAKALHPSRVVVAKAIVGSTERRLDVVRMFTTERSVPDLAVLITGKGSGDTGRMARKPAEIEASKQEVFAFDWSIVASGFDAFAKRAEAALTPRKKIKEPAALEMMGEHYQANKASLPPSIREHREAVIELIMEGVAPEAAFAQVIARLGLKSYE